MTIRNMILCVALAAAVGACDSDDSGGTTTGGGGSQGDTAGGGGGGGTAGDTAGGGGGGGATGGLTADPAALHAFLSGDSYSTWAKESAVHDSPIHGKVMVYVNKTLEDSLTAGNASHPEGAGAVKELYAADGTTLRGWAVMLKTQADSEAGKGWYWYETTDLTDASKTTISANGDANCTGCHGSGGADFFKTKFPLQ